ncbi:MAG: response regulator transcription factor, partial [Chloroflexi bacterium]|nr:response regulator transcription factor [Chloroflexota bacterium]
METLRILVADDSQFMRTAYKRILETQENFEVVGMAVDGEDALQQAIDLVPDVAILDVRMPKLDGLETAHRIRLQHPGTAIVMISAYDDLAFVAELLKNGPEGKAYLLKSSLDDIGELIRVIDAVTKRQTVLDPSIVLKLTSLYIRQDVPQSERLTHAQRSVLELIAEGRDDSYIARNLGLEEESVA